jgi:hypothetical protein
MSTEQDSKQVETVLTNRSIAINEGAFLLRLNETDINDVDFSKLCLYGDALPSAYSRFVTMIPTGIFLPQLFAGKNIFMEHKDKFTRVALLDHFLPYAFLIRENGHSLIKAMYDKLFQLNTPQPLSPSYSETYNEMISSVKFHLSNYKKNVMFPDEVEMLHDNEEQIVEDFRATSEHYTVLFVTYASAIRLLDLSPSEFKFGTEGSNLLVTLNNSNAALFDGVSASNAFNIKVPERICKAIQRELLTMMQFFVGYDPSGQVTDYIANMKFLFKDQLKSISCSKDDSVKNYCVSALKLYLSRSLELDDNFTASPILSDPSYEETIRKKILFQLLMLLDVGSALNSRNIVRKELSSGKPILVCANQYTNPFNEICGALYENVSWITHSLSTCMFFTRVKNRKSCESCGKHICAVNIPSLLFNFSTNAQSLKRERSSALLCFLTSNPFNKTGPLGNLRNSDTKETSDEANTVSWEKHHKNLLNMLFENTHCDLSLCVDNDKTTDANIDERAEKVIETICLQLDNWLNMCDQFYQELEDGPETVMQANSIESEIRNVYKITANLDKGFTNVLLSEGLMYLLRCILLHEQSDFEKHPVNDIFLKVRPLFLDNKSGFKVMQFQSTKDISIPRVGVKTHLDEDIEINIQSKLTKNYKFNDTLYNVSFKCKAYLFGRYNELKGNGKRKTNMIQNMSNQKQSSSYSNSFLYFKNFCSKKACDSLGIHEDEFSRHVLNEVRDDMLDKYANLFKYTTQFKVEDWLSVAYLISVVKTLEYLKIQPSYDKIGFLTFNKLADANNGFTFQQQLLDSEFNAFETLYGVNCNLTAFSADIQGTTLHFKKCSIKPLDSHTELLNSFSASKMHPGPPLYYMPLSPNNSSLKTTNCNANFLLKFLNEDQYKLEKDAAYTDYIKKNRKKLYDCVFEATFSDQGLDANNKYKPEILEEMMDEFDSRYPITSFVNEQVHTFVKLVLEKYFDQNQQAVNVAAKRIKEINMRVKNRNIKRVHSEMIAPNRAVDEDDDEDETQFLNKKQKL